ncbi:MAG: TolC family protein [Magnetococcus sp. DMHC-1]|nr:TolC family protein [Magnetococcales bacterium]
MKDFLGASPQTPPGGRAQPFLLDLHPSFSVAFQLCLFLALTCLAFLGGGASAGAASATDVKPVATADQPVGASVAELLELARSMNPDLAAATLEAAAAEARVQGADALPDPKLQMTLDDISENAQGLPGRAAIYKYTLQQEIPWWGKRDVKREIAAAESREAEGLRTDKVAEVVMKVKIAYADYHRVHLSMDQTDELIQVLRALVEFARLRYAQGMGGQQEATSAEAERGALAVDLVRLEKERHRIRSRLNVLVNRPPHAPLVEHPHLRSLPSATQLEYDQLLARGLVTNPALRMERARLEVAEGNVRLAQKNWFPDLEMGVGFVNRRNAEMQNGFEAMLALNLPLQWEPRRAQERDAALKKQMIGDRLQAERLRVESGLREALLSLEEARQVEKVTRESLLPQARIALQSTLKGYENGGTEALNVLDAVQRLKKFQIDLIKAQFEQQVRLAEIERFVGEEL